MAGEKCTTRFVVFCVLSSDTSLARLGEGCLVRGDAVRSCDVHLLPVRAWRSTQAQGPGVSDRDRCLARRHCCGDGRHRGPIGTCPGIRNIHTARVSAQVDRAAEVEGDLALATIIGAW